MSAKNSGAGSANGHARKANAVREHSKIRLAVTSSTAKKDWSLGTFLANSRNPLTGVLTITCNKEPVWTGNLRLAEPAQVKKFANEAADRSDLSVAFWTGKIEKFAALRSREIAAEQAMKAARASQPPQSVRQALGDLEPPVTGDLVVPPGWQLDTKGITRLAEHGAGASILAPLVVVRRLRKLQRQSEFLVLAWLRDGTWHNQTVERSVAADSRRLVELAGAGAPINSNNSRTVVQYLADFEAANIKVLPTARVAEHLGWVDDDPPAFLLGNCQLIGGSTTRSVEFAAADEGDQQMASGFHSKGHLKGWRQAVAPLADFPRVRLAVYASLAAPLVRLTGCANFLLDFAGATTVGKTTALRIAASLWGNPQERDEHSAIRTWAGTRVFRERAPALLAHLPFIVDDTKLATNREEVGQAIYDFSQGRGRGRGTVKGTAVAGTWQTVMLSSGEQPITSFSKDGGTRARVLTVWGSPFERADNSTRVVVEAINRGILQHYGHAGERWIRWLEKNWKDRSAWCERYGQLRRQFADLAEGTIAARQAEHFALLALAAELAAAAKILPWEADDSLAGLFREVATGDDDGGDVGTSALQAAWQWAASHPTEFWPRPVQHNSTDTPPYTGWAGVWKRSPPPDAGVDGWEWIGFLPDRLKKILDEGGFSFEAVVRTWAERGWFRRSADGGRARNRLKARLDGANCWVIAIERTAVDRLRG